ncbi:hypothetical protein PVAP13_4KG223309 [Panicum virgatum]|uniref:Uncharacterized protein n=2 Tax=Panicum virgatum TaxID=38727 RepID=A0A8T0TKL6_PANVG|nr:hypothetical protein PVAP13_4KG223309 [Panicum virgatum]
MVVPVQNPDRDAPSRIDPRAHAARSASHDPPPRRGGICYARQILRKPAAGACGARPRAYKDEPGGRRADRRVLLPHASLSSDRSGGVVRARGPFDMALGAEMARRAFPAAGGADEEVSARAAAAAFLAAETGRPVDPVVWGDEKRMKRELVAWAKAVASMAAAGKNASRRRRRP